jgi:hypothetical protein
MGIAARPGKCSAGDDCGQTKGARVSGHDFAAQSALCGEVTVELSASQSVKHCLNSLNLDFEEATINIPQAFPEHSSTRTKIVSSSGRTINQFEAVNPYRKEVRIYYLAEGRDERREQYWGSVPIRSPTGSHHRSRT